MLKKDLAQSSRRMKNLAKSSSYQKKENQPDSDVMILHLQQQVFDVFRRVAVAVVVDRRLHAEPVLDEPALRVVGVGQQRVAETVQGEQGPSLILELHFSSTQTALNSS